MNQNHRPLNSEPFTAGALERAIPFTPSLISFAHTFIGRAWCVVLEIRKEQGMFCVCQRLTAVCQGRYNSLTLESWDLQAEGPFVKLAPIGGRRVSCLSWWWEDGQQVTRDLQSTGWPSAKAAVQGSIDPTVLPFRVTQKIKRSNHIPSSNSSSI